MPIESIQLTPQGAETALDRPWLQRRHPTDRHGQLVEQSQKLVSNVFFGTILKQMRDSSTRSELFSGGKAGQTFQTLFDQQLADRMSTGHAGKKLVASLVKRFEKAGAGDPAPSLQQDAQRRAAEAPSPPPARAIDPRIDVRG